MSDDFNTQSTSESANPMLIHGDIAPTRRTQCSIMEFEDFIKSAPQTTGERWIHHETYEPTPQQPVSVEDNSPPKRRRTTTVKFTMRYQCHRRNAEDNRTNDRRINGQDDPSFHPRLIQKKSKQVGCPATLKATCYLANPDQVVITYKHAHMNHVPGSIADVQHLPYSDEVRDRISEELKKGYDVRDVRTYLQREYAEEEDTSHDAYITTALVYNIFYKYRQEKSQKDMDDFTSVKSWLMELQQREYSIWIASDDQKVNNLGQPLEYLSPEYFAFGFVSPWQKDLLSTALFISLDATHDVCDYDNGVLYTMVIRHPLASRGVPVAYMFTNDQSSAPLVLWFQFLKSFGVNPQCITIDRDLSEDNAISTVWPDCTIQYCIWHVSRAWISNVQSKVKGMVGRTPAQARVIIRRRLFELMYEKDTSNFHELLGTFLSEFQTTQRTFIDYFRKYWVDSRSGEGYDRWAACYEPEVYTNMQTNNYVETWHNQLKTVYLKRKRLHRLDLMIDMLITDVEFDIKQEVRRLSVNVGRMSTMEHAFRTEEQKLAYLSPAIKHSMVDIISEVLYHVNSLSTDDLTYEVRTESGQIITCTCEHFQNTFQPCKHMFLVEHVIQTVTVRHPMANWQAAASRQPSSNNQRGQPAAVLTPQGEMEKAMKKLIAKANHVKRRVTGSTVDGSDSHHVEEILGDIANITAQLDQLNITLNGVLSIPPNLTFRRQNDD